MSPSRFLTRPMTRVGMMIGEKTIGARLTLGPNGINGASFNTLNLKLLNMINMMKLLMIPNYKKL